MTNRKTKPAKTTAKTTKLVLIRHNKPDKVFVPTSGPLALNGLTLHMVRTGRKDANDRVTPLRIADGVVHAELTLAQLQFLSVHLEIATHMEDNWLDRNRERAQDLVGLASRCLRSLTQRPIRLVISMLRSRVLTRRQLSKLAKLRITTFLRDTKIQEVCSDNPPNR